MLNNVSKLGSVLNKAEQQAINGGIHICALNGCPEGLICVKWGCIEL